MKQKMEPVRGGEEWMVASLWGMRCVDDLDLPFISHIPTDSCISHTCYLLIFPVPLHVPYFSELPPCLCIFSTLLGAACQSPTQELVIFCLMYKTCLVVCLVNRWLVLVWFIVSLAVIVG